MCQFCGSNEAETETTACTACGDETNRGDLCEDCHQENHITCDACGTEVPADQTSTIDTTRETVCNDCAASQYTECDACGRTYHNDNIRQHNYDDWCDGCFHDNHAECNACGEMFHRDSLNWAEADCYCHDCYEECSGCKGKKFTRQTDLCERVGSLRTFGVELETSECEDFTKLSGKTYFTSKYDGSISGEEFVTGVLSGDEGLDAVSDFCDSADDLGFAIDRQCGYHLHVGVGDLSEDQRKAVAKAYYYSQRLWQSFVSESRRSNSYCPDLRWTDTDVDNCDNFEWFCDQDRYQWFNLAAWGKHQTFEVRLHGASLNGRKINNWIIAHIRFIEYVANYGYSELKGKSGDEQFAVLCKIWDSPRLARYYQRRAEKFGTTYTVPTNEPATPVVRNELAVA